jgi:uncharacterized protein (TIGR02145 family)
LINCHVFAQGTITSLNCASAVHINTITAGVTISSASSLVQYSGGNGGAYSGQTRTSTGVTGLTATLSPGTFAIGSGNLTYVITGTPSSAGTASFALSIGGRTCTLTRLVVPVGSISALNCALATHNGSLISGLAAASVNSSVPYSGGNGGSFNGRTISSTGVVGLTASILAGSFLNGSGNLSVSISGTPNNHGTASFALNIGGKTCTLTRTVLPGSISSLNCLSPSHIGTLTEGRVASAVNSTVYYDGGNGGNHSGQVVNSTGVSGLTATLPAGRFAIGGQQLTYTISGTPTSSGTASFALNIGGRTCVLTRTVYPAGTISTLNCGLVTHSGTLIAGLLTTSGVNSIVSYSGGNGGTHNGQSVISTGVAGLTATVLGGIFANGTGSLTYFISGTPIGSGIASFALNIGGRTCTIARNVLPGSITVLQCASATHIGVLTQRTAAIGITSTVPYTGGNSGSHNGQSVNSTGVTGLTAVLTSGRFLLGNGSLTYTISGTPIGSGVANFELNIGGQRCNLSRLVASDGTGAPHSCGAPNVHNPGKTYGTVSDVDGNVYKTIVIGSFTWMAENLRTTRYRNGDLIANPINNADWNATIEPRPFGTGAWCHMNNNPANECPYGKLYNFFAVVDPRGLCPTGWTVPSEEPFFTNMISSLGGESIAGGKLKSAGNHYWASPNSGASNSTGFSGLPGGFRWCCNLTSSTFGGFLTTGQWWTGSFHDSGTEAFSMNMTSSSAAASITNEYWTRMALSVRCVKNSSIHSRKAVGSDFFNINLYPNPTASRFSLDLHSPQEGELGVKITDMQSRVLIEEKKMISEGSNTLIYNIENFASGMYLVHISNGSEESIVKIVKE